MYSLESVLLMEARRIIASGNSTLASRQEIVKSIMAKLDDPDLSLKDIKGYFISDPGLILHIIDFANCILRNGLAQPKCTSIEAAINRLGTEGIRNALYLYQFDSMKKKLTTSWRRVFNKTIKAIPEIGNASYLIARSLKASNRKAEKATTLAILNSASCFNYIAAASSLSLPSSEEIVKVACTPSPNTNAIVLAQYNCPSTTISEIKSLACLDSFDCVSLLSAGIAWRAHQSESSDIELAGKVYKKAELFSKCH